MAPPMEALDQYVITEQLVACFDNALGFIRAAPEARSSKAAYLDGSFGAGKSHFMAAGDRRGIGDIERHRLFLHREYAKSPLSPPFV